MISSKLSDEGSWTQKARGSISKDQTTKRWSSITGHRCGLERTNTSWTQRQRLTAHSYVLSLLVNQFCCGIVALIFEMLLADSCIRVHCVDTFSAPYHNRAIRTAGWLRCGTPVLCMFFPVVVEPPHLTTFNGY